LPSRELDCSPAARGIGFAVAGTAGLAASAPAPAHLIISRREGLGAWALGGGDFPEVIATQDGGGNDFANRYAI
jgi:hypothetical protein